MIKKEFVSMSLPYGLKVLIPESNTKGCRKMVIGTVGVLFDDGSINCYDTVNASPDKYKPILKPMKPVILWHYSLEYVVGLIKKHFDVAGLIAKGQAIDVNTLKVNPYKKSI
jgi:hypothetical protein